MTFEFNNQLMPQSLIDIDDAGQCSIEAINDEGYFYYLIIRSSCGITTAFECGPVIPDVKLLPSGYKCSLTRFECDEKKLSKTINLFLNDKSKKLTSAQVIELEDAIEQFRDMKTYLKEYGGEIY